MTDQTKQWNTHASKLLVGRTIKAVSYMLPAEVESHGWEGRALMIELDNGLVIYPSQDDEGNGPGALFTSDDKISVLPVLR